MNGAALRKSALSCIEKAQLSGIQNGLPRIPPQAESQLIDTIASCLSSYLFPNNVFSDGGQSDFEIAAHAIRWVETCSEPPSFADLCATTGVGQTRLYESFMAVHGVSPARFLKMVRMIRTRDWLSDLEAPPRSVKDAALFFGFGSGGRFAVEYAKQFRESPSTTLTRTLRAAGF